MQQSVSGAQALSPDPWVWIVFNVCILAMLALDLFVFHRDAHAVRAREAAAWSAVWVALALVFNVVLYHASGPEPALAFLTGYLIEKALSVDNIFVFVLLFSYFQVPAKYQHRVLFWGILGALVMRGAMIAAGAWLIQEFHWILYVFGAFLVLTGIRMATHEERALDPESNLVLRFLTRFVSVSGTYDGQRFFTTRPGPGGRVRRLATPLFVVLVMVETTDLIFAVDSIPAIFAVTQDPFLVYSSNVFAILGLRALYFLLAGIIHRFHFLKLGLSAVLVFVGAKMLIVDVYRVPVALSLAVVAATLAAAVAASLIWPRAAEAHTPVDRCPMAIPDPSSSPSGEPLGHAD
ncbi:MAG TPA: TerC family protein [Vicinamibacterales bacterium]|nr:TerC family protein [Vicinamibacterales bacterium]